MAAIDPNVEPEGKVWILNEDTQDILSEYVVEDFIKVEGIIYTKYTSQDRNLDPLVCFPYTILTEQPKEIVRCDDGVCLLQELRKMLDEQRSFGRMVGDFHLYELIIFSITLSFMAAFTLSIFYVVFDTYYFFDDSLLSMFLIILGFNFGKDIIMPFTTAARSRMEPDIVAALKIAAHCALSEAILRE